MSCNCLLPCLSPNLTLVVCPYDSNLYWGHCLFICLCFYYLLLSTQEGLLYLYTCVILEFAALYCVLQLWTSSTCGNYDLSHGKIVPHRTFLLPRKMILLEIYFVLTLWLSKIFYDYQPRPANMVCINFTKISSSPDLMNVTIIPNS